eukprot:c18706_g1_i1.p1 GENE.c18706_g1_i1~~c18706_g1_i1.p1  ORF type:complete len:539 (+),score=96.66 c18706_g1_i1:85-1701(+)
MAIVNLEFPLHGVSISVFDAVIARIRQDDRLDDAAIQKLTTYEVCQYVRNWTADRNLSYCEMLDDQVVGRANVLISHAWKCQFVDLVEALKNYFANNGGHTFVWFDVFSLNQNAVDQINWHDGFSKPIKDIGRTVMVLSPLQAPEALKRSWCLYELSETICSKPESPFGIAVSRSEEERFHQKLSEEYQVFDTMLANIDMATSEATKPEDQDMINRRVGDARGFDAVNKAVFDRIRAFVKSSVKSQVDRLQESQWDHPDTLQAIFNMGVVCDVQGEWGEAARYWQLCLDGRKLTMDSNDPKLLLTMEKLGTLYFYREEHDKAVPLLKQCAEGRPNDVRIRNRWRICEGILETRNKLEKESDARKKGGAFILGVFLLLFCSWWTRENHLKKNEAADDYAKAWSYSSQGKYDAAESLFRLSLEKRVQCLGDDHPDTLTTMNSLAEVYVSQLNYTAAEKLFEDCLRKRRRKLGQAHNDTLTTMSNLADVYVSRGNYIAAKSLFEDCLKTRKQTLGQNHSDTLTSMRDLAKLYALQEKAGVG